MVERSFGRHWALPLRIILGLAFMVHGAPKLFDAAAHQRFEGSLARMGVPAASLMSWVVGIVEFFGGIALVIGAFTWIAAALLAIDMIFAILLVHGPHGFSNMNVVGMGERGPILGTPGYEMNLVYLAGLLALFIGGPGPLSVDARVRRGERALRAPWWREHRAHA